MELLNFSKENEKLLYIHIYKEIIGRRSYIFFIKGLTFREQQKYLLDFKKE